MAKSTPLRKLTILRQLNSSDYHAVRSLQKEYSEGNITLIESCWGDQWKNNNPEHYNLPERLKKIGDKNSGWNKDVWCTYSNLLTAKISVEGKRIYAEVVCDNGDIFDGMSKSRRWTAKFQIKAIHLNLFKSRIDYVFTQNAAYLYEKELSLQAEQRIEEIEKELLNK